MARRRTIVDEVMEEIIIYGGLPVRRGDAYTHALRTLRTRIGDDNGGRPITEADARRGAEMFAFGYQTRLAPADAVPLTLEELEALP